MKKQVSKLTMIAVGLVLAAALSRLLPHPFNFSPVAAMALFGGAVISNRKLAFMFPLAALFLSDLFFQLFTNVPGFYGWSQLINYGAFLLIVLLGTRLHNLKVMNMALASLAASFLFFLISNFGVWVVAGGVAPYTHDAAGIWNTYVLAIPFLGNTVIGDLVYCGILFGGYALIRRFAMRHSMA